MKIIIISGTPGTGKTSVSRKISEMVDANLISLNELAISENFTLEYDKERDTNIVDFDKLIPYVANHIDVLKKQKQKQKYLIIEGHFSDIIPNKFIDYSFVLRCDPEYLYNRLKERNYNKKKIIENIQAEILGNCANYLIQKQLKSPIYEIDTTHLTIDSVAIIIMDIIVNNKNGEKFVIGKIDWLEKLASENRLSEFFKM